MGADVIADVIKARKSRVRPVPVTTVPAEREIGTAEGDFEAPEDFDAALPDHVLAEFEG